MRGRATCLIVLASIAACGGSATSTSPPPRGPSAAIPPLEAAASDAGIAPRASTSTPTRVAAPAPAGPYANYTPPPDEEAVEGCTPSTHPLAVALTRDTGTVFEAQACERIGFHSMTPGEPLTLPGVVVRPAAFPPGTVRLEDEAFAWRFVEKYRTELKIAAPVRGTLRLDAAKAQFVQRVAGTTIESEGIVRMSSDGDHVREIHIATMDLSRVAPIAPKVAWGSIKSSAFVAAEKHGLAIPHVTRLPSWFVTREHGVVGEVQLAGVDLTPTGTRQTDYLHLRVAVRSGAVISKRTEAVSRPTAQKVER